MNAIKESIAQIRIHTNSDFYIVGGFIRDFLLKRDYNDIDLILSEDALTVAKEFAYNQEGSFIILDEANAAARVILKNENLVIDFSRIKGKDIVEDLMERDYTINAMALKVGQDGGFDWDNLIDPTNGKIDMENKCIRMLSEKAFQDDPLRMIRGVRFAAQLDFDIEDITAESIKKHSEYLMTSGAERISHELFQILKCNRTHYYFNMMDKHLDLLNKIFPEIEPMKQVGQCKYHVVDSWAHSLYTLNVAESIIYANGYFENHLREAYEEHTQRIFSNGHTRIQLIKLAALFHDIGKPSARWTDETGRIRFKGHEITGMEIVADISDRLKLSNKEKQFLCKIVKEHMWPLTLYKENDVSGRAIYDLFKNFGEDTLDVLLVSLADIIATRKLLHPHEEMGMYKVHIEYLANNYLTRFRELMDLSHVLNGNEVMEHFDIEDGKVVGQILEDVRKAIFFGKIPAEKERAIQYIEKGMFQ
ncbi:HD domain-containing protein [Anaerosolibacter sp.]|uniref:HD domain-containing protein n=1 Tax=Anaerosolibacter sp. TaxID=1872527 RepID=UPI0039EE4FDE